MTPDLPVPRRGDRRWTHRGMANGKAKCHEGLPSLQDSADGQRSECVRTSAEYANDPHLPQDAAGGYLNRG